jgi:hypothetical protein
MLQYVELFIPYLYHLAQLHHYSTRKSLSCNDFQLPTYLPTVLSPSKEAANCEAT